MFRTRVVYLGIRDHEDHHSSCNARYSKAEEGKARQSKETGVRMKAKGRNRIKKRAGGIESRTERETERAGVRKRDGESGSKKERRRERE